MVQHIPAPDPHTLLPPLLACLPASFASARPPPALLPLLSPILRQRVQLLSTTSSSNPSSTSSTQSWLPLLCWDAQRAAKLPATLERASLEPHPVSGEIEIPEVETPWYRRLDRETLHARIDLEEYGLLAIYLWVESDEATGGGPGWRLAELRALEDRDDGTVWVGSMAEADERAASEGRGSSSSRQGSISSSARPLPAVNGAMVNGVSGSGHSAAAAARQQHYAPAAAIPASSSTAAADEDDDDDSYWASYDRTPGRTPARTPAKRSPAPRQNSSVQAPSSSELEYFARYMAEVQPAMDPHDPGEAGPEPGESTLDGGELARGASSQAQQQQQQQQQGQPADTTPTTNGGVLGQSESPQSPHISGEQAALAEEEQEAPVSRVPSLREINSPRPSSPDSLSGSVERLEQAAAEQSMAEVGIKQHISTDIKSLYRLAKSAGIERGEFERIVRTELEVLGMMDEL